jgi:hypothetical protein
MQNRHLLDSHLFGARYKTLCVVLALHVTWDLIAGVTLLVKSLTGEIAPPEELIMHVQDGHTLETHNDVPEDIREQLYAEEQRLRERDQKATGPSATGPSTASHPPITITNVLPAPPYQPSHLVSSPAGTPAPDMRSKSTPINRLNIRGPRESRSSSRGLLYLAEIASQMASTKGRLSESLRCDNRRRYGPGANPPGSKS